MVSTFFCVLLILILFKVFLLVALDDIRLR